jgi:hypothetical protein
MSRAVRVAEVDEQEPTRLGGGGELLTSGGHVRQRDLRHRRRRLTHYAGEGGIAASGHDQAEDHQHPCRRDSTPGILM